jgi:hypothetical protein
MYQININRSHPDLAKLNFVIKAMGKDNHRKAFNYLHVRDSMAIATDGHRMHWAGLSRELPDGVYEVTKSNVMLLTPIEDPPQAPDFAREMHKPITKSLKLHGASQLYGRDMRFWQVANEFQLPISYKYFGDIDRCTSIALDGDGKSYYATDGTVHARIMGLRA